MGEQELDLLQFRIDEAKNELYNCTTASEKRSPVVYELLDLIPQLFDKIAHGEQGHRDWLKKAIEAHFRKEPMPDYVAK